MTSYWRISIYTIMNLSHICFQENIIDKNYSYNYIEY